MDNVDLVSKLKPEEAALKRFQLKCISPDDAKYGPKTQVLQKYLSAEAEWFAFANVQRIFLETRVEFGRAEQWNLDELLAAIPKLDPLNMALLEEDKRIGHDQIAVLEEIGRYVSPQTKAMLHPGTTSYDVVDPARAWLFRNAWKSVIRPEIAKSINALCDLAEKAKMTMVVGRTHLQNTSPITYGSYFAATAARLADRVTLIDEYMSNLRGKVSGITGTGAGIEMVIGLGKSMDFEKSVLQKLGLEPDYTASQITMKERLADIGHGFVTLMAVLYDFSEDIRKLYSSAIAEVTSADNAARLGGSSTDALKNNPIQWENISGTFPLVQSGMTVLYAMIQSDFQRDLRNSKMGRYQPQQMMTETYESFSKLNGALKNLSLITDNIDRNLEPLRKYPSEAMVTILRGEGWVHPTYGVGHDFVKEIGKIAIREKKPLLDVALEDPFFSKLFKELPFYKQDILAGKVQVYLGTCDERTAINIADAKKRIESGQFAR